MTETTDFEKTQKSKQYLKLTMSDKTDFEKNTKIQTKLEKPQYLKLPT